MPVMDGITATKEIRKIEKLEGKEVTPIIGLSGNAREFHATNALKNGLVSNSLVTLYHQMHSLTYHCRTFT